MCSDRKAQDNEAPHKPSKTQQKKSALVAQRVGEALTALSDAILMDMALPAELREAVMAVRFMHQRGARRRQMQYIGALMRTVDVEALQHHIEAATTQGHEERRRFKQVERWRDELMAGDENRLAWLVAEFPNLDRGHLEQLMAAITNAKAAPERRKAAKALFRYLRNLIS